MKTILGLDGVAAARSMAHIKPSARQVRRVRVFIGDGVLLDSRVTVEKRNSEATRHDDRHFGDEAAGGTPAVPGAASSETDLRPGAMSFFRKPAHALGRCPASESDARPQAASCFGSIFAARRSVGLRRPATTAASIT